MPWFHGRMFTAWTLAIVFISHYNGTNACRFVKPLCGRYGPVFAIQLAFYIIGLIIKEIGGADEQTIESLRAFGMAAGLAFQIQDDLINLTGSDKSKDFRIDITEGKRTLVAIHALKNSLESDELLRILEMHTNDDAMKARAVEIMKQAGSLDYARNYALGLVTEAKSQLNDALPASRAKDILLSMADYFIDRKM